MSLAMVLMLVPLVVAAVVAVFVPLAEDQDTTRPRAARHAAGRSPRHARP
ncbi:hypothetical protein ACIQ9P_33115 [Kitasatospora sp. NPDC094019]